MDEELRETKEPRYFAWGRGGDGFGERRWVGFKAKVGRTMGAVTSGVTEREREKGKKGRRERNWHLEPFKTRPIREARC